jgi:uncharacterized membrane protein YfcA
VATAFGKWPRIVSALATPILLVVVSLIYATFLAVMAVMGVPAAELRPIALILNIVAAGYATRRLHAGRVIDWRLLACAGIPALLASFLGGRGAGTMIDQRFMSELMTRYVLAMILMLAGIKLVFRQSVGVGPYAALQREQRSASTN